MFAFLPRLAVFLLLFTVFACSTHRPGVIRSVAAEKELGDEQKPAFLLSKGGLYTRTKVQNYVEELTAKLSKNVTIPDGLAPIDIRVLDTNTPSAYALPGGSIYVSRGIIAMSNTEAQIAGVIAHEIGHVVARHSAKAVAANERFILDVINQESDRLSQETSQADRIAIVEESVEARRGELTSFSKEHELEADALALQILTASGYETSGYGVLLERLERWQLARARRAGVTQRELEKITVRSGYPKLTERIAALGVLTTAAPDEEATGRLMSVIDGTKFDDLYSDGIVQDSKYWNRFLSISVDVPDQLLPEHGKYATFLFSKGFIILRVDNGKSSDFAEVVAALSDNDTVSQDVVAGDINGIPTVKVAFPPGKSGEDITADVIFYDLGRNIVSLTLLSKQADRRSNQPLFKEMYQSLKRIKLSEIPKVRRYKTRRLTAQDSVTAIAQQSAFEGERETEIRILNGLEIGETLTAGDWIKSVR